VTKKSPVGQEGPVNCLRTSSDGQKEETVKGKPSALGREAAEERDLYGAEKGTLCLCAQEQRGKKGKGTISGERRFRTARKRREDLELDTPQCRKAIPMALMRFGKESHGRIFSAILRPKE